MIPYGSVWSAEVAALPWAAGQRSEKDEKEFMTCGGFHVHLRIGEGGSF